MPTQYLCGEGVQRHVRDLVGLRSFATAHDQRQAALLGSRKVDQRGLGGGDGDVSERWRGQELLESLDPADLLDHRVELGTGGTHFLDPRFGHGASLPGANGAA